MQEHRDPTIQADPSLVLALPPAVFELLVARVSEQVMARLSPGPEGWVGVAEAARHLGCKLPRIYDLVCRRAATGIPHRKEGTRLLFKLSALDRWIDAGGAA
ncbi:helix-turn-helix domain-containing protein [Baekduia soli]|uniref:Helix-turn-helix domain-containing protein n=1 Tax=Baekduia soli TaxID=496014 RepID=A0A5B8U046_9ACTN|nr:helix-turn-helix domain-containing protein [Baekduia soli]QEC46351.1 helix-turn-helix domain-containing protein [Baekduia soli]